MDYEVFILTRINEEYEKTADKSQAVVRGIGDTGRLVTSGALILCLAFIALGGAPVTDVKILSTGPTSAHPHSRTGLSTHPANHNSGSATDLCDQAGVGGGGKAFGPGLRGSLVPLCERSRPHLCRRARLRNLREI